MRCKERKEKLFVIKWGLIEKGRVGLKFEAGRGVEAEERGGVGWLHSIHISRLARPSAAACKLQAHC